MSPPPAERPEQIELVVGRGAIWPLRGNHEGRASAYVVTIDGREQRFAPTRDPAPAGQEGYFLPLAITHRAREQDIRVEVEDRRGRRRALRSIRLRTREHHLPEVEPSRFTERVVIALSTHDPDPALLSRQIESLRAQSLTRWRCLVRDDGSTEERFRVVRDLCAGDARFLLVRDAENRGFYASFERCLASIPEGVEFIAFCDQDDRWHPDKLARALAAFDTEDVELVYSDMRLTDETGRLISPTFWVGRRHSGDDLDALLFNNPVTGAAAMIRRRLLPLALPFPEDLGRAYHDHWLACVARTSGRLRYIDAPLHDYTQHRHNVIGHEGFRAEGVRAEITWALGEALGLLCDPDVRRRRAGEILAHHATVYRKLALFRGTLLLRLGTLPQDMRRALDPYQGRVLDAARLVLAHGVPARLRGNQVNLEDVKLAAGLVISRLRALL